MAFRYGKGDAAEPERYQGRRASTRMKGSVSKRNQAERSSVDRLLATMSARWEGSEPAMAGSLRAAAVRLHNQNMKMTVVSPNESHPTMNTWSQCILSRLRDAGAPAEA